MEQNPDSNTGPRKERSVRSLVFLLLGIVVGALVIAAGLRMMPKPAPASVVIDPALLTLVPSDTTTVAGVRVDKLRGTSTYTKFIEPNLPKELDQFVKETQVDPRKDLQELLFWTNGKESSLILRGKFSRAPLAAIGGDRPELRLVERGWKEETIHGLQVASLQNFVVGFVNSSVAVVGERAGVTHVLAQRGKGGPSKELQVRIEEVGYRHQIWAASTGSPLRELRLPDMSGGSLQIGGLEPALRNMQGAQLGVDLKEGAYVEVKAVTAQADDATLIHDALRGVIGLGRLQTKSDQRELLQFFDALKVSAEASNVFLRAQFTPEQLERAWTMVNEMRANRP